MRLIDADLLKQNCKCTGGFNDNFMCVDLITLAEVIDNQPTAYDVDAVVKELEDSVVCGMFGARFGKSDTEIIDIIRKGGAKRDFLLGSYNR